MELRQLRYVIAVAEAGSLSSAAAKLHISQPPLSVAIAKLETSLGVDIFTRSARGVELTPVGHYLVGASERLLGEVDRIHQQVERYK